MWKTLDEISTLLTRSSSIVVQAFDVNCSGVEQRHITGSNSVRQPAKLPQADGGWNNKTTLVEYQAPKINLKSSQIWPLIFSCTVPHTSNTREFEFYFLKWMGCRPLRLPMMASKVTCMLSSLEFAIDHLH